MLFITLFRKKVKKKQLLYQLETYDEEHPNNLSNIVTNELHISSQSLIDLIITYGRQSWVIKVWNKKKILNFGREIQSILWVRFQTK